MKTHAELLARMDEKQKKAHDEAPEAGKITLLQNMLTDEERLEQTARHHAHIQARHDMRETKADLDCALAAGDTAAAQTIKALLTKHVAAFHATIK